MCQAVSRTPWNRSKAAKERTGIFAYSLTIAMDYRGWPACSGGTLSNILRIDDFNMSALPRIDACATHGLRLYEKYTGGQQCISKVHNIHINSVDLP